MTETRSTCCYCGVGCGVLITHDGQQITDVRGDPEHPANFGRLCTKGSTLHLTAAPTLTAQTRLLQPLQRAQRGGPARPMAWDAALDWAAQRLAQIHRAHGADAIGVYVSGQLLTEDYYVFNKLVKGLLGSNQIDTNSRLCMSSAVAGYKATLGSDAPPCSYDDLAQAETVFVSGSNMAWAHPILFRRLEDAKRARPSQRWIVADPRRTETAEGADLHLALKPGSDVALCHGLLHLMLAEGWVDQRYIAAHTQGFGALAELVAGFTPERTAALTGLPIDQLRTAARWFADSPATLSLYCQGLNQSSSGTAKNAALINLHLATGQIGRPGAGPFSLTGQPNAMGGREVGGLANLLSAHRDLANPAHRAELAALWGLDRLGVAEVPAAPGRTAVEMFEAAADGEVKALWIACTNPAQSLPDQATVQRALQRAEFVIVQEAFATTATAAWADLLLPATTWGEKDGTVTNSERRISRVRPAVPAPGLARHDWDIAADLARRLAERIAPDRRAMFDYASPEAVWLEHRETTRGRDLDITGLSYALLDRLGPQQWPMPEGAPAGRARLYEDGRFATPDGRARFVAAPFVPLAEACDEAYPFSLNTGRLRDQWHGMSRTGQLGRLYGHEGLPCVDMHPDDLRGLGVADGALVRVRSRRGEVVLGARASDRQQPGQVFIAMHWGGEVLGGTPLAGGRAGGVNTLTNPARCPSSKQPEFKHAAVSVAPVDLPWRLTAMAWLPNGQGLAVRERLKAALAQFPHASLLPFGREPDAQGRLGLVLRAAAPQAPDEATVLAPLRALLGLDAAPPEALALAERSEPSELSDRSGPSGPSGPSDRPVRSDAHDTAVLAYRDAPRGQHRLLKVRRDAQGQSHLAGFWLAGDASGESWLRSLVEADQVLPSPVRSLLAPGALLGRDLPAASPQVCACFDVKADRIEAVLQRLDGTPERRLAGLQAELKCGTNCGSCLPTLRGLVKTCAVLAVSA